MFKIGLEKEFFVLKDGRPSVVPMNLPYDACGLLAEARGLPFTSPEEAVFSLMADVYRVERDASAMGFTLSDVPFMTIGRDVRLAASRTFAKGLTKYQNIYGYGEHRNRQSEHTAGIHISFTKPVTVKSGDATVEYYSMFDWLTIFKALDKAFATEIKMAKRNPGFYEIKHDGRIEYRSLPANVSLTKIIEVLHDVV